MGGGAESDEQPDADGERDGDAVIRRAVEPTTVQRSYSSDREACAASLAPALSAVGRQGVTDVDRALSISSFMRIEESLAREVSLVRDGSHIALTSEDIQRIHDPGVLRFLQDNSDLFAKYMCTDDDQGDGEGDDVRDATLRSAASHDTASLARDTAQLRRDIDTFITAVDAEGRQYQIRLDQRGGILVPLQDDGASLSSSFDEAAGEEEPGQPDIAPTSRKDATFTADCAIEFAYMNDAPVTYMAEMNCTQRSTQGSVDAVSGTGGGGWTALTSEGRHASHSSADATTIAFDGSINDAADGELCALQVTCSSTPCTRSHSAAASRSDLDNVPARDQMTGSAKSVLAVRGDSKQRARGKVPVVRPQGKLQPHEAARVADLMRADFTFNKDDSSPFALSNEAADRVSAIDRQLATLRLVRGPLWLETEDSIDDTNDSGHATSMPLCSTSQQRPNDNGRTRGNLYMNEVERKQSYNRAVHAVNRRLLRLHREVEQLSMMPAPAAMDDAQRARPRWALADDQALLTVDDATVRDLLAAAQVEEERAAVAMHDTSKACTNTSDPLAALRRDLAELVQRAVVTVSYTDTNLPCSPSLSSSCDDQSSECKEDEEGC